MGKPGIKTTLGKKDILKQEIRELILQISWFTQKSEEEVWGEMEDRYGRPLRGGQKAVARLRLPGNVKTNMILAELIARRNFLKNVADELQGKIEDFEVPESLLDQINDRLRKEYLDNKIKEDKINEG